MWENDKSLNQNFKKFQIKNKGNGEYYYVNKEEEDKNNTTLIPTHTRMGSDGLYSHPGSYSIPSNNTDYWEPGQECWGSLHKFIFVDKQELSLTEKHLPNKGPILIDIDMKSRHPQTTQNSPLLSMG